MPHPVPAPSRPLDRLRSLARVLVAIGVLAVATGFAQPGHAATSGGYTIELSKTNAIADGEVIDITVSAPAEAIPAQGPVYAHIALCRADPALVFQDIQDLQANTGNCVYANGSGSMGSSDFAVGADAGAQIRDIGNLLRARQRAIIPWAMGTGVSTWSVAGQAFSLTCDPTHPCSVVVVVNGGPTTASAVFPVSFRSSDAVAACKGSSGVPGSHPFRLGPMWTSATVAACALPGAQGAPTQSAASGEDENLAAYGRGDDDITYTGVGYHDMDLLHDVTQRPSVAVPIALNASVLGFSGGTLGEDGRKVPYAPLAVTTDEFAKLFSGGMEFLKFFDTTKLPLAPRWQALRDRNPDFTASQAATGADPFMTVIDSGEAQIRFPLALGNGDAATWVATNHFTKVLGAGWKSIPNPVVDAPICDPPAPGEPVDPLCPRARGPMLAAAQADPSLRISTIVGTASIRKLLIASDNPRSLTTNRSVSVITDAATANWLGVTPAALSTGATSGPFVAPTAASLAAAVPAMLKDQNGMRFQDPATIPAGAYPMTFVEYALVPVTPPSEATTCTLRSWLTFLTTGGQQHLGGGLVGLTPELRAEAAEAIAKVGAGTSCSSDPGNQGGPGGNVNPPTVNLPGVGDAFGSSNGGSGGSGLGGSGGGFGGSDPTPEPGAEMTPPTTDPPIAVVVPDFAGSRTAGALLAVGAMVAIGVLTWLAAMYSAQKLPWQQPKDDAADGEPEVLDLGHEHLNVIELD